eukprot:jgi/Botrbrau1/9030/Bobra.0376s0007.1
MEFSISNFFGDINGLDPETKLESDFQYWLASKRVCWDLLYFTVNFSYSIAFLREGCPEMTYLCGLSSLLSSFLCLIGMMTLLAVHKSYCKMRQHIFVAMWYTIAAAGVYPHVLLERAASFSASPGMAFAMMLLLKVPALILLHGMFPVKVDWAPFVHILATLAYHVSSVHAATHYARVLRYHVWVQRLVAAMNGLLFRFWKKTFLLYGEPPAEILAELELPEAILSTAQCLLCVWLLIQASLSWTCLLLRAREELNERRAFLAAFRLPYRVHWDSFQQSARPLAAMHFLVCVHLVVICPFLFEGDSPEAGQMATLLR